MKIRISPLMLPMVAVICFSGKTELYIMAYAVMTLHETAHLLAAVCIGLRPESITFSPFGVNLKLKNKIISSVSDEIILYGAGPLVNAVFALLSLFSGHNMLYRLNTALLIMNLMPVIPLDGGMICMRLLSFCLGQRMAKRLLSIITGICGVCFSALAVLSWCRGYINISMFIFAALMLGNALTSQAMCDVDFINTLSCRRKRTNKVKCVFYEQEGSLSELAQVFSPNINTVVFTKDKQGHIIEILTEEEVIRRIGIFENDDFSEK